MTTRRNFIALLGAAVAWPLAARGQQPAKVPRVGILSPAASETAATLTAFREGIRDLGYVERETIALDFRLSNGIMDALPALAAELVRIPVNVIVTDTTGATLAAFDATRAIPIVMGATGGDPVALGLAKSLSRPGGNVTGTQFLTGLSQKRLQLLKQAFPGTGRIAVLANPKGALSVSEMPKVEMAAAQIGVRLLPFAASTPARIARPCAVRATGLRRPPCYAGRNVLEQPGDNPRPCIYGSRARHLSGAGIRR
jgi:putative ABC transport system substrate-binding protein